MGALNPSHLFLFKSYKGGRKTNRGMKKEECEEEKEGLDWLEREAGPCRPVRNQCAENMSKYVQLLPQLSALVAIVTYGAFSKMTGTFFSFLLHLVMLVPHGV